MRIKCEDQSCQILLRGEIPGTSQNHSMAAVETVKIAESDDRAARKLGRVKGSVDSHSVLLQMREEEEAVELEAPEVQF